MDDTEQTQLDPFREMNRYTGRHKGHRSEEVYEEPRRTLANYWRKFHAARDCGSRGVYYIEEIGFRPVSGSRGEYKLRCWDCGYEVDESNVLFIGGDWFNEYGWIEYGDLVDSLWLPEHRVLELGPDPDRDELVEALNLTRIERESSSLGITFQDPTYRKCEDCGKETMLLFDERCRMCYDGEWTDRMQDVVDSHGVSVRERNGSFVHRLEDKVDPFQIHDRCFEDMILWRRHAEESVSKLVEVKQCLKDDSDGHWEYVLTDPTHTVEWRYHEDDIQDCFWDTGLYNKDHPKPVMDDRIREIWKRVREEI